MFDYDRLPWIGAQELLGDHVTICPTDTSPLYTDTYSAGTNFVYLYDGAGMTSLSIKLMPLPPLRPLAPLDWCGNNTVVWAHME